jgi:hypothetical protein
MLGGFTGFKGSADTDLGEKFLNQVASQAISRLFSASEHVDVQVRCFPSSKILQGVIDSFKMLGRGLVIRHQFPVAEMSFETDTLAIDFGAIMRGELKLKQPTQAIAQVVLSEAGINEAFRAELVRQRLENVSTPALDAISGEEPVTFRQIVVQLRPQNQITIYAQAQLPLQGLVPFQVSTTLTIERRRRILFTGAQFQAGLVTADIEPIAERLAAAFIELLNGMVDLDCFDLDGVTLRLNRLETQSERLVFSGYAQIDHFPRSGGSERSA